ncbi:MAG: hypothetical protein R3248_07730 [Candidatus Promineifilaceae bacterium]|nr:hypothetical protein [Candidatus Promineifilaceae bacterium]
MKRILIVEPDENFATRLFQALVDVGDFSVSSTPTMREACLVIAQEPHDLAFVPVEQGTSLIRSLRSVQRDLRLVAVVPTPDSELPPAFRAVVQGMLARTRVRTDVKIVLERALGPRLQPKEPVELPPLDTDDEAAEEATLLESLQSIPLEDEVLTALLSEEKALLAHGGTLNEEQAMAIARRLAETWELTHTAQIQFIRLPSRTSDLLLYTRPVGEQILLTLAARPNTLVGKLRRQADAIAARLGPLVNGGLAGGSGRSANVASGRRSQAAAEQTSYAIVWRPREPLSEMLHIPLRRALERIAETNACVLTHLDVDEDLVHVVVACPPGRTSAWAAHLFKQGAEAEIQKHFGMEAPLWEKGYHATESAEPLEQKELNLFLKREV